LRLVKRIAAALLAVLAAALAVLAFRLQHDTACPREALAAPTAAAMNAVVHRCYGSPEVLHLASIERPHLDDDQVLVQVRAASVNPLDWHYLRGTPYIVRLDTGIGHPENIQFGVDFAGTIVEVGRAVSRFHVGDAVFGGRDGAFAEYVSVREQRALALKPDNVSFEQAAAAPIAGISALQALRDKGHVHAGDKVLINGASGGVGTFAVQIAKAYGAEVTGVCSTRNVELVRSLGADHVIDYTREDFTRLGQRYDLIIDTVGSHALLDYRSAMTPHGTLVIVGGPSTGNWLGPLATPLKAVLLRPFVSQHFEPFLAELSGADLAALAELMHSGKVTAVIDRSYPLGETAAAMRYVEAGHTRGKVVLSVP
jgi:NADPH:quinone reductase-like Zn-dependent oxidoreductase